ncbi:MAG: tetratricopeptide repeat protein [Proteobacteria bacterium]|nr:tetratricopeptide repeat protein [Pseudomonadota bacterium]
MTAKKIHMTKTDSEHILLKCMMGMFLMIILSPGTVIGDEGTPYWQNASILLQNEKYFEAYEETERLLIERPKDALLLRIKGISLLEIENPTKAVSVLQYALDIDPGSVACRYYLAQAFAYRGSLREAISMLETVLAMAPDSEYARLARGVLPELMSLVQSAQVIKDSNRWNLYARLAEEYDNNVPVRSNNSTDTTPKDSWRSVYTLYGEVRYPDQKLDKRRFTLGTGYAIDGNFHQRSSLRDYDLFSQAVNLFINTNGALLDKPFQARLQTKYTDTRLGDDGFSNVFALQGSFEYQWHSKVSSTFKASWDKKDYLADSPYPKFFSRDGREYTLGVHNNLFLLDNRLIFGLHYSYRHQNTEGSQYKLQSHDITGSVKVALPWSLQFQSQVTYQQQDYPEFFRDPPGRLDDVWTIYSSLQKRVWKDWLNLEISYTHSTSSSSQDFAEYERSVFGVGLTMNF